MEWLKRGRRSIDNLLTASQRSSAGANATPARLLLQGVPAVAARNGWAMNPLSLFIIINGRCNLSCRMCDIGQNVESSMFYRNMHGAGDFPFDRFTRLMKEVAAFRPHISITSTEPLIYRHINEAVALVKDLGMEMNVTTNGATLVHHADELVRLGLDKLTISIDGPAAIHDAIRGAKGLHERIMRGIDAVHDAKLRLGVKTPRILVNTTICDLNADHLAAHFDALPWDKIERAGLMPMVFLTPDMAEAHNRDFGADYPATPTCLAGGVDLSRIAPATVVAQVAEATAKRPDRIHLYYENSTEYLDVFFNDPARYLGGRRCIFPWYAAQIDSRGDLLGLTRCYAASFGNVFEDGFAAAWNGAKMRKFRMDLQRLGSFPACTRCEGVLAN